jgi:hypothetical protein
MSAASPDELIYDEAQRAIGRQQAAAAELRHGASLLIAAAAISISLLDERSFADAAPVAWLALGAFLVVSLSALAVIWPPHGVPNGPNVGALVSALTDDHPDSQHEIRLRLIRSLAFHQQLLTRRTMAVARSFRVGALGLVVQLSATVASRILTT